MKLNLVFCFFILLFLFSCNSPNEKAVDVDFSQERSMREKTVEKDTLPVLSVAIAPVISPRESFIYYKELFDYMGEKLKMKIEFRQRTSYMQVNNMLGRNQVDIAFICTGSYIESTDGMDLLVAPVIDGKHYYHSYVITNNNSDIYHFEDLEGKSFAFTDSLSTTGKIYPLYRIMQLNKDTATFFSSTVHTSSHDVSIQMVARNLVEGASVNGLIFDYLQVNKPHITSNVRIIETSEPFGVPPVVSPLLLDDELKEKLQQLFLNMHQDVRGRQILDKLLIDRFELVDDSLYVNVRKITRAVWQ